MNYDARNHELKMLLRYIGLRDAVASHFH